MNGDRLVDVLSVGDGTLTLVTRSRDGGTDVSTQLLEGVTGPYRALDLNQGRGGDTLDVIAARGSSLALIEQSDELSGAAWETSPVALPDMGGTIRDLEIVDHDHDGDLDLLVVGDFGARLLMNAGAGAIVDASGNAAPAGHLGGRHGDGDAARRSADLVRGRGLRRGPGRGPAHGRPRRHPPHGLPAARTLRRPRRGALPVDGLPA